MEDKVILSLQTLDEYTDWKLFQNRILWIDDTFEEYNAATLCGKLEILASSGEQPIKLIILSPGGQVFAAMALYDTMLKVRKEFGIRIIAEARGYAASAAAIILQGADYRTATPHTRILIHEVSTLKLFADEKASDMEEESAEIQKVNDMTLIILSERSGHSLQDLKNLTRKKNVWFSAQEALDFNLIDAIV